MTTVRAFRFNGTSGTKVVLKYSIRVFAQYHQPGYLQVMSMGFAADSCREALKLCYGDVQRAINMLESCGGALSSIQQLTQGTNYL